MQADITYIDHSGFFVELPEAGFLFDYYQGRLPSMDRKKPLVVFVSHKHQDHYNPEIFKLQEAYEEVWFVVAKDVPVKRQITSFRHRGIDLESRLIVAKKNTDLQVVLKNGREIGVTTMKSTDEGVAFLVTFEGKTFYHAGDLNQWVWDGESQQYNDNMRKAYLEEMRKLQDKKIHVAFVPADPRLEAHGLEGLEVFLAHANAQRVFPMHFWGQYEWMHRRLAEHREWEGTLMEIKQTHQHFAVEI